MRVTQNMINNTLLTNMQASQQRVALLEQQSSSQLKVSAPGDDPVAAQQILSLQSQNSAIAQYSKNNATATSLLSMSDSAMSGINDALSTTYQLALSMSNSTNNSSSMSAAADQLKQLKSQVISLGNTNINGTFVFGGFKNDAPPFDSTTGAFTGTSDDVKLQIGQNSSQTVNYSGAALFGTSGGADIMGIFDNLATALNAGDNSGVQAQLDNLTSAMSQVNSARSVVGASLNALSNATSQGSTQTLAITTQLSKTQDADYLQVVSSLTQQQTAYQTTLAATAQISKISLLNYL